MYDPAPGTVYQAEPGTIHPSDWVTPEEACSSLKPADHPPVVKLPSLSLRNSILSIHDNNNREYIHVYACIYISVFEHFIPVLLPAQYGALEEA